MKTFKQFMKESEDKELEGFGSSYTSFGSHSTENGADDTEVNEAYSDIGAVHAEDEASIKPLHNTLVGHYTGYKPDHVKALKSYTTSSRVMNHSLYSAKTGKTPNGAPHDQEVHDWLKPQVAKMDKAVGAHKTPEAMHVYSGTGFSPARYKAPDHKPGDPIKVHLPSFTSTSISKFQAEAFSERDEHHETHDTHLEDHHHMLKIHVPAGHKGAYVDHITNSKGEREFVLPRDTKLHVHDTPELSHGSNGPTATWHATIVKK